MPVGERYEDVGSSGGVLLVNVIEGRQVAMVVVIVRDDLGGGSAMQESMTTSQV